MKKIFPYKYIVAFFFTIVLVSCSVEKNTLVTRSYHNLTSRYNVYFNGNEALKAGLLKIETQVEEDYTKILPIYKESLPNTEKIVSSDMTTVIEKGVKLIKFHSITKPPKINKKAGSHRRVVIKPEYNNWVDNAYINMGRAYLYRKEYIMAISTFQLVIRKYKNDPVKYDASLWLIRCYNESEQYTEATQVVQTLESDKLFPKKLEGELSIVAADLQMKQQHFDEAIHSLNIGIKKIHGNKRKSRYTFILGQLYQETGKKEQALEAYHQVIRRNPEYSLLFNARIKSAEVSSGSNNVSMLRKELNKMRKKKWNEPYLDQIYYALGNISFNEGKIDDAIDLYKKSVASSKNNIHQKALSSLTLGDIYFDRKNYIPSSDYYDSAMVIIDNNYPNYEIISQKYSSISNLVKNLKCIETEDSLQRLAALPKADLDKLIAKWIDEEKKKQEATMTSESEGGDNAAYYRANSTRMRLTTSSSGFYFYNTSTVSYGKKEFSKLWGDRKNEDDWRRKNKSASMVNETGETVESELAEELGTKSDRETDPTSPEYYTQDLPVSDSMKQVSNIKVRDALFNAGSILKNDFSDFNRSVGCFSDLNSRYPTNIYLLSSWFNLWDLYKTLEKTDSSDYYRNLIIKNYPESNYAKYLVNPNFFIEEAARKDSVNKLYSLSFNAFKENNFKNAGALSRKVLSMKPDTSIESKAQFIRTIAETKDLSPTIFADSLKGYINRYPTAQPVKLAEKILTFIKQEKFTNYQQMVSTGYLSDVIKNDEVLAQTVQKGSEEVAKWDTDNELLHYFIIAFPSQNQIDVNRLKFDIANYNLDHYTSLDFEIETENLNQETSMVIVRNFENKESAMVYFMAIIRNQDVFKTLAGKPYLNFVASNNNYRQMLNDRKYDDYIAYFIKYFGNLTTGKFSEKELESPEALMARLKQDPDNDLKEQGEFVVVDTKDPNYIPVKKEQLFNPDHNLAHTVTIFINQKNAGTGYFMRDLIKYNSMEFRDKRLKVVPGRMNDYTLLSITSFANAYEANEYLKSLNNRKDLFSSLGDLKYQTLIASDDNLKKLIETGNIDEYNKFYQTNYIRRTPQAPKSAEVKSTETKQEEAKPVVENKKENTKLEEKAKTENKVVDKIIPPIENSTPKADTIQNKINNTKPVDNTKPATATQPLKEEGKPTATQTIAVDSTKVSQVTENGFIIEPETIHNLIFLLPIKSPNQSILISYLKRLNAINYGSDALTVTVEPLNDSMEMVVVKGLKNKAKAVGYFNDTKNDPRISMSLKNANCKTFMISNNNLQKLKSNKDIAAYQQFHDKNY